MNYNFIYNLPLREINSIANEYKIDTNLLITIVQIESGGNEFAVRYEPKWSYVFSADIFSTNLGITKQTEEVLQSCSWGLTQMMGTVARELKFQGHLTELCDPELNLDLACEKIKILSYHSENESDIFAMWNGGIGSKNKLLTGMYKNQKYVDKASVIYDALNK